LHIRQNKSGTATKKFKNFLKSYDNRFSYLNYVHSFHLCDNTFNIILSSKIPILSKFSLFRQKSLGTVEEEIWAEREFEQRKTRNANAREAVDPRQVTDMEIEADSTNLNARPTIVDLPPGGGAADDPANVSKTDSSSNISSPAKQVKENEEENQEDPQKNINENEEDDREKQTRPGDASPTH
jgi:hypothetical protein